MMLMMSVSVCAYTYVWNLPSSFLCLYTNPPPKKKMMFGELGKFELKFSCAVAGRFNFRDPEKQTENSQFWKKNIYI